MRERLLAGLGALALIAVAFLVREALADDGDGRGGRDGRPGAGDLPTVACTPDLAAVCDALVDAGQIAPDPPALDLDGATDPDPAIDAWITWDPAPRLANFDVGDPPVWDGAVVLASGRLAVAGTSDDLAQACPTETDWTCASLDADAQGLTVGVGDPATAEGIARLLPVAQVHATDDDPSTLRSAELDDLIGGPADGQDTALVMATWLATRPGAVNLVVGPELVLGAEIDTAQGRSRELDQRRPAPASAATIVIAARRGGDDVDDLLALCDDDGPDAATSDALAAAGGDDVCAGSLISDQLAGFLYQVREKVS